VPGLGTQSYPTEEQIVEALGRGRRMRRLETLFDRALAVLPAHLRNHVVVFGSAPMVLAGLKPDVGDLDLFVCRQRYGPGGRTSG
jgi:hypothetical protein